MVDKVKLKKWADILIDTDLRQCRAQLYDGIGYCCMGVYAKEILGMDNKEINNLPSITYDEVKNISKKHPDFFWHLNDEKKKTFKEIGEIIYKEFNL